MVSNVQTPEGDVQIPKQTTKEENNAKSHDEHDVTDETIEKILDSDPNEHIQAVHEKLRPFICQYCTYATSSQPNLRKHIKAVHHKIRDFKCSICPFDAASKQLLVRHVQAVHEKIKAYKCKFCQYECAKGYNMKVHIRHVHEKQKGYKCEQCSFEAIRRGKLTEHQLACHGISLSNQNSCEGETPEAETIIVQSAIETRSILVE